MRHGLQVLCVLLASGLAGSVGGQTLFKSTDRDGRVSYGDKPLPGSVKVEQLRIVPFGPEDEVRGAEERERLHLQAEEVRERERQRQLSRDQANAAVLAALEALKQAQRDREAGVEPMPGERLGNKGGGSRLADPYFKRQRELDRRVSEAQERLERAYARLNDLR